MSRLKDQMIKEEANFWDKAESLLGSCEDFSLYNYAVMSLAPNFLMNSPTARRNLQDQLLEGWTEFWQNKNA